jgi:hypothetical protein
MSDAIFPEQGSSIEHCPTSAEVPTNAPVMTEIILKGKKAEEVKIDASLFAPNFQHPGNLDECKLKRLDDDLVTFWSKNEATIITVNFSRIETFDNSDKNDFVLRAAGFWQRLASHYVSSFSSARSPDLLLFGVLAPSPIRDIYRWNGIEVMLAAAIRDVAARHVICVITPANPTDTLDCSLNPTQQPTPAVDLDSLKRGVNIGRYENKEPGSDLEWFPQPANSPDAKASSESLTNLASTFDHVRVVITPNIFLNETTHSLEFAPNKNKLTNQDNALTAIWKQNLATIVTIDALDGTFMNPNGTQKLDSGTDFVVQLIGIWQGLAQHLISLYDSLHLKPELPKRVFFEILNEPQVKDVYRWWGIQEALIIELRKSTSNTLIATGAGGLIDGLLSLVPVPEPDVIYSFHYYDPYEFTHQGADWVDDASRQVSGLQYPSNPSNASNRAEALPSFEVRDAFYRVRYGLLRYDRQFIGKRLSNTPVPGKRFVLKFSDELRTEGFITQTTYTRGSSGVSGRVCEQRYAAERVLPQSAVELRYAESAPEGATLEEKEPSIFFGRPVGAGGVGGREIADAGPPEW